MPSAESRREALKAVWQQAQTCAKCPQLASTRTKVVFGAGNADADLMFVGEAPGANEDKQGLPFVGQAGKLLDTLLGEIGLSRPDVFIANTLKCRPPGNRDPLPGEIDACQDYLFRQLELIEPRVVCTLGNFATKLLRADLGDRHHAAARAGGDPHDRAARGPALPALPPGGGALHALDARDAARRLRTGSPSCSPCPRRSSRAPPEAELVVPEPEVVAAAAEPEPQLGLF